MAKLRFKHDPELRCLHNRRRCRSDDDLGARARDATAWAGQLRRERKMKVQRQKEKKQQRRGTNQPAQSSFSANAKNCHGIEANRWLLPCQPNVEHDADTPAQLSQRLI